MRKIIAAILAATALAAHAEINIYTHDVRRMNGTATNLDVHNSLDVRPDGYTGDGFDSYLNFFDFASPVTTPLWQVRTRFLTGGLEFLNSSSNTVLNLTGTNLAVAGTNTAGWFVGNGSNITVTATDGNTSKRLADWMTNQVDVMQYGADPTGVSDSTTAIQNAMNKKGNIYIPSGTYLIDPLVGLIPPSNTHITLAPNATITSTVAIGSNGTRYWYVNSVDNVIIEGGRVLGDHTGADTNQYSMGIQITSSANVTIRDMVITNLFYDGVYVGGITSSNIILERLKIHHSGRNGIALCGGTNITARNIIISVVTNTTPLEAVSGLDIEPEVGSFISGVVLDGVYIDSVSADDGHGQGLYVNARANGVVVRNSKVLWAGDSGYVTGTGVTNVVFDSCLAVSNALRGFESRGQNVFLINCNSTDNGDDDYDLTGGSVSAINCASTNNVSTKMVGDRIDPRLDIIGNPAGVAFIVNTNQFSVNNGKVGVGTGGAAEKLQVSGGNIILDNATALKFYAAGGAARNVLSISAGDNLSLQGTDTGSDLSLGTSAATLMTLKSGGNIGIGTIAPANKLDVNGTIAANSVIATNGITLPSTTNVTMGVVFKDAVRFIHDFHHPTGATAVPDGHNLFIGVGAGNFTLGSTAAAVNQASRNTLGGYAAGANLTLGYDNTGYGADTFAAATTAYRNTYLGSTALANCVNGFENTALGMYSLWGITSGADNVGAGMSSGAYLANGVTANQTTAQSVYIGANTKASADGVSNENVFGNNATGRGNNTVQIGDTNVTDTFLQGNVHLTNGIVFSDGTTQTTAAASSAATITVLKKTTNYTLLSTDSGKMFTQEGAASAITNTLPDAAAGLYYYGACQTNVQLSFQTAAGDYFVINAAYATNYYSSTLGGFLKFGAINESNWVIFDQVGTWAGQ